MPIHYFWRVLGTISLWIVIPACNLPSMVPTPPNAELPPAALPTTAQEATLQHVNLPASLPAERSSHAGDYDSSQTASDRQAAGGDRFTFGRFERPFNANTMDVYSPDLDIVDTFVFQDDTWIYGTLQVKGPDPQGLLPSQYALELDLDIDGKGDWLIMASNPSSTEWRVEGVQLLQDVNGDVGDESAMYTDKNATSGDGFETLVFDEGHGIDPDAAWVRISPAMPNIIEICVKRAVLDNPRRYLINMWAGTTVLDPRLFDLNDHFTHEQAGAADKGFEVFYPIKAVAEVDNSCRMAVGFEPTGFEPGLCEVFIPPGVAQPTTCIRPRSCLAACGYEWNPATCTCTYSGPC